MKHQLYYNKPAENWMEAQPIGNGRLGAMVFGQVQWEMIQLNEDSLWGRWVENRNNPHTKECRMEIAELLQDGKLDEAEDLAYMGLVGAPKHQSMYQTLGELKLRFFGHRDERVTNYSRVLDMHSGIVTTEYDMDDVHYTREVFSSYTDQALVINLTADKREAITVGATIERKLDFQTNVIDDTTLTMHGKCGMMGTSYHTAIKIVSNGEHRVIGKGIQVKNANQITIYLTTMTDYYGPTNYKEKAHEQLQTISGKPYANVVLDHTQDHGSHYSAMAFDLSDDNTEDKIKLSIPQRMDALRNGEDDAELIAKYVNYARYLLVSSSRKGYTPANLQGIWNDSVTPIWDSKYTCNINVEMNYWPAEAFGLGHIHEALIDFIDSLRESGRKTARDYYGCKGFVVHHNTDLWKDTMPCDHEKAGVWPLGGVWLSLHAWEHYEYCLDKEYLKKTAYPIMKEAVEFLLDFMIEDENGTLLIGPSCSPENRYIKKDGQRGTICMNATSDIMLAMLLMERIEKAAAILDCDVEFVKEMKDARAKLPTYKIGSYGQLQEWAEDYKEEDKGHRHTSHLLGVFPYYQTELMDDVALREAARVSLQTRYDFGDIPTGWTRAWHIGLWSRLNNVKMAYTELKELLANDTEDNLFDTHPAIAGSTSTVFQIDGNMGATAGIFDMLIRKTKDVIEVLPVLPKTWKNGDIKFIRIKGGIIANIEWADGCLTNLALKSIIDQTVTVRYQGKEKTVQLKASDRLPVEIVM